MNRSRLLAIINGLLMLFLAAVSTVSPVDATSRISVTKSFASSKSITSGWQPWFAPTLLGTPPFSSTPSTTVTAVWRTPTINNTPHLDVFTTNREGAVWSTWWEPAIGWQAWFAPTAPGAPPFYAAPGTTVTAVWRTPTVNNTPHLDIFTTNREGAVWSTWWEPTIGWQAWFAPAAPGAPAFLSAPGTTVTAVWRTPTVNNTPHLDVFTTNREGAVWSTWWEPAIGWQAWFAPAAPGAPAFLSTPGTTVTAVWRTPTVNNTPHLDVFTTNREGAVWSTWWEPAIGWQAWFAPAAPGAPAFLSAPGTTVTAVWRTPTVNNTPHLDVFTTNREGAVWSTWWEPTIGWQAWFAPAAPGAPAFLSAPGTTVTAVWRTPTVNNTPHLDIFTTNREGAVWSTWWEPAIGWQAWFAPTAPGSPPFYSTPGATVTVVWRTPTVNNTTHLDIFTTNREGAVWSTWWETPLADIGFRPNPNGYSFANYGGVNGADYTIDDMRRSFGDNAVCASVVNGQCIPRQSARQWNATANNSMGGGHCYGMAITSLRFFKGIDSPGIFQNGAATAYELQLANARRNIAYYHVRQLTDPARRSLNQGMQKTPAEVLAALQATMSNGAPDPAILVFFSGMSGHAVTPYAIEDRGNSIFWIYVYDNNWPNDPNRYVEINTAGNTWSYGGGLNWIGNASTHSIGIEQISNDAAPPVCPWCKSAGTASAANSQIWSSGQGNLLAVDDQGRRVGTVGSQVVTEIPGSFVTPIIGGLGKAQSIYSVPLSGTHTLILDGQALTQTVTTQVTQFGPGYAVAADGITLKPSAQGQLTVAADGREATYQASDTTSVSLTLALDDLGGGAAISSAAPATASSYTFQMSGIGVGGNQRVRASVDAARGVVVLDKAKADGGSYDLQLTRSTSTGEQTFVHPGLQIAAGDTQYVDYANWNGSGSIVVKVDHGSDGTIDQTTTIANTAYRVYLPVVVR